MVASAPAVVEYFTAQPERPHLLEWLDEQGRTVGRLADRPVLKRLRSPPTAPDGAVEALIHKRARKGERLGFLTIRVAAEDVAGCGAFPELAPRKQIAAGPGSRSAGA